MPVLKYLDPNTGTYKPLQLGAVPPVSTGSGIGGNGTVATPVVAKTSATFGTAPLDTSKMGDVPDTLGRAVYVDSAGQLRVRSDLTTFDTSPKNVSDLPSTYVYGTSLMTLSTAAATAGGWPYNFTAYVLTNIRYDSGGATSGSQIWMRNTTSTPTVWYRSGSSGGWTSWVQLYDDTGWVNLTPASGTGTCRYRCVNQMVTISMSLSGMTSLATGANGPVVAAGGIPAAYRPSVTVYQAGSAAGAASTLGLVSSDGSISQWNNTGVACTVARLTFTYMKE